MTRRTFLLTPLALRAAGRKPNIVLVIARGWRGVSTPWSGDPNVVANYVRMFGEEAVVFPRAYAAYPRSSAARGAIASGKYPHATRVTGDGAALAKDQATLGSALAAFGYHVTEQVGLFSDFSEKLRNQPYFFSVMLDPHMVGVPDDAGGLRLRENVPEQGADAIRQQLGARYGAYVAMSAQFSQLMGAVDAGAVVVFTADAGEQIGSHGLDGNDTFYEESVRVPLAIRIPGVRGSVSDVPVSQVDLMPTILGMIGADPVEGVQGRDLSAPIVNGHGDRPETVLIEGRIGQRDEWRALVEGSDKIVTNAAGEATHLFNLAADPYEMRDLVQEKSAELKRAQMTATIRVERSRVLDFRRR